MRRSRLMIASAAVSLSACSVTHHVAIGERLGPAGDTELKGSVDATGVNTEAIGGTTAGLARTGNSSVGDAIAFVVWATTFAPATGNATTNDTWADDVVSILHRECPHGVVTGIQMVREATDYEYVSGELVSYRATCHPAGREP